MRRRDSREFETKRHRSMGRYDDSSDEHMSPDRTRRRPVRPPSPRERYVSPPREEYEPVYESRSRYEYKRSTTPEYKRAYYAPPAPERHRVAQDPYDRYGGPPPPHVMHYTREFRPPMHHETGYVPRGPSMRYGQPPPYHMYPPPRHMVPRHPVPEYRDGKKFPNYLDHVKPEDDPEATRTLFVGNLEVDISEEELRRIFGKHGVLEDIDIKRPAPGTGNAFAFIRFQNLDMSYRAKVELSGQYIGKLPCKIGYPKVKPTATIWIGGLGAWTSHIQLEREFDRFGAIKKIDYQKGDTQAYIFYESIEAAQAAAKEMRGFALGGPDKRLRIDFFDPNITTSAPFKPKPPPSGSADYYYHDPYRYGENNYYPPYARGGYRGRGRGRGSYRGAYSGYENHRPPLEEDIRRPTAEMYYDSRPSRYAISREPVVERSRSRSPIRRRSPDSDSHSSSRRNGVLSTAHTLQDIARKSTSAWSGAVILKNSLYLTKFYLTDGDIDIIDSLKDEDGKPHLRIVQRLALNQSKLENVQKRISTSLSHAVFLGLAGSPQTVQVDIAGMQTKSLSSLVSYFKEKEAVGVISLHNKETETTGVLYAFPPCEFSSNLLKRTCHKISEDALKEDHLVIVVVRGGPA